MCTSDEITNAEPDSLFKIYWYIDGEEAHVSETEYKSEIQKTYLTEFNGFYRLGVKVKCNLSLIFIFIVNYKQLSFNHFMFDLYIHINYLHMFVTSNISEILHENKKDAEYKYEFYALILIIETTISLNSGQL